MTLEEYNKLVQYINRYHNFGQHGKMIKYIRCSYDTRTQNIFSVTLDSKSFTIVNDDKDRNLKQWVYDYLKDNFVDNDKFTEDKNWQNMKKNLEQTLSYYDILFRHHVREEAAKYLLPFDNLWFNKFSSPTDDLLVIEFYSKNGYKLYVAWSMSQRCVHNSYCYK